MNFNAKARTHLTIYLGLAVLWVGVVAWMAFEHQRVKAAEREYLLNRARDISNTIALVSRSGRMGLIRQERLEEALVELTQSGQLKSVALLNSAGEIVADAGEPLDLDIASLPRRGTEWARDTVTVVNLVDFGVVPEGEGTTAPPLIVIPTSEQNDSPAPPPPPQRTGPPPSPPGEAHDRDATSTVRQREDGRRDDGDWRQRTREFRGDAERRRTIFQRPFWMDQEEYEVLLEKQGLHGFIIVLRTDAMRADLQRDAILRTLIAGVALIAVGGLALAWGNRERSTELRMRLVRSHELNEHLREMNLAAAGLAHETRNPLNIVRGMAQLIDKDEQLDEGIHARARQIVEEVDQVTYRLNEFIKYSRPTEPRAAPADLTSIVRHVQAMLESDAQDKKVTVEIDGPPMMVLADESLLRQVLFNLLLNAIQSVGQGGHVRILMAETGRGEASLVVEDDGPGVPPELRNQIFRPYFTTRHQGTGLGLAVVRQIVLAHRWEVDYEPSALGGAGFRLRGLKILKGASPSLP